MKVSLFLLAVLVAVLNQWMSKEINFVIISGVVLLLLTHDKASVYKKSIPVFWPVLLLSLVGFLVGLTSLSGMNRDFYRDIYLFLGTFVYFTAGVQLSKYVNNFDSILRYFALVVVLSSVLHLWLIATNFGSYDTLQQYRKVTGMTNLNEAIFLAFICARFLNQDLKKLIHLTTLDKVISVIILISFLLYFSRTMIVTLVVLTFFLSNFINIRHFFSIHNRRMPYAALFVILLVYSSGFIVSLLPPNSYAASLAEKFERIPEEVFWSAKDSYAAPLTDINDNWRGYEASQGMLKFKKGDDFQKVAGHGFGAMVNLGIIIKLANKDYEKVPILHNGYVSLLVKCGITGLILYLVFLYKIGFSKTKPLVQEDTELYYLYQLLSGMSVVLLLNTFTITGLFSQDNASVSILLGLFWGIIQRKEFSILGKIPKSTLPAVYSY